MESHDAGNDHRPEQNKKSCYAIRLTEKIVNLDSEQMTSQKENGLKSASFMSKKIREIELRGVL